MSTSFTLKQQILNLATNIQKEKVFDFSCYQYFLKNPKLAIDVINLLEEFSENLKPYSDSYYFACIAAFETCIGQLQFEIESNNKQAEKVLLSIMQHLAIVLRKNIHNYDFWFPLFNCFYEMQVHLTSELKEAYYDLAAEDASKFDKIEPKHVAKSFIENPEQLSDFNLAETFFAQTYAMPEDLFMDFLLDMYQTQIGVEIGLLCLLHPNKNNRDLVINLHDQIIDKIILTPKALTRLAAIKYWYPKDMQIKIQKWINIQRKKGVVFSPKTEINENAALQATEIDIAGSQGIIILFKAAGKNRLANILFSQLIGIKDIWITGPITLKQMKSVYKDSIDEAPNLRNINLEYFIKFTEHFLQKTLALGNVPKLSLLEVQELLGVQLKPKQINAAEEIEDLSIKITPFTMELVEKALAKTKKWYNNKYFTKDLCIQNSDIDKIVNYSCFLKAGNRYCNVDTIKQDFFITEFENKRCYWVFYFLWITLWLLSDKKPKERLWQETFFLAYALSRQKPFIEIPIMHTICDLSIDNSLSTMYERCSHLHLLK